MFGCLCILISRPTHTHTHAHTSPSSSSSSVIQIYQHFCICHVVHCRVLFLELWLFSFSHPFEFICWIFSAFCTFCLFTVVLSIVITSLSLEKIGFPSSCHLSKFFLASVSSIKLIRDLNLNPDFSEAALCLSLKALYRNIRLLTFL